MTINQVIDKHYKELYGMCKKVDTVISCHQTSEDVFQNVMVTAIKKYKDSEVDEDEALGYLRKSLGMEFYFMYSKIDNREVSFNDSLCPPNNDLF